MGAPGRMPAGRLAGSTARRRLPLVLANPACSAAADLRQLLLDEPPRLADLLPSRETPAQFRKGPVRLHVGGGLAEDGGDQLRDGVFRRLARLAVKASQSLIYLDYLKSIRGNHRGPS